MKIPHIYPGRLTGQETVVKFPMTCKHEEKKIKNNTKIVMKHESN